MAILVEIERMLVGLSCSGVFGRINQSKSVMPLALIVTDTRLYLFLFLFFFVP